MGTQTGRRLSDDATRAAFRNAFERLVRREAQRLCGRNEQAEQLCEYVFLKVEKDFEYRPLPEYCEPFLIGQTCIAFAVTGGDAKAIQARIAALRKGREQADQ